MKPVCCHLRFQLLWRLLPNKNGRIGKFLSAISSCKRSPTYSVVIPPDPYNYTHTCQKHLGDMITDAYEHQVVRTIL